MEQFELYKGRMAQLASSLDRSKIAKFESSDYWMEPKLDGFRALIKIGEDGVEVLSRSLKPFTGRAPHIEKALSVLPVGTILDGEIGLVSETTEDGRVLAFDFTGTTNIMRSDPAKAVARQKDMGEVTLVLFDVLQYDGKPLVDEPNTRRRLVVDKLVDKVDNPHVVLSASYDVAPDMIETFLSMGMEGVMVKRADAPYLVGMRRVGTWYKVKMSDTTDAVIMGYTEADKSYNGNHRDTHVHWYDVDREVRVLTAGGPPSNKDYPDLSDNVIPVGKFWHREWIGAIEFGQIKDGVLTKRGQCSGMSDEQRKDFTFNGADQIGRVLEVKHNGADGDGLRHPQFIGFRDDKTADECDWS